MYLTRQAASTKLPIPRKGTKYIARASSNLNNSVPAVIAIRDMLKLAKNAKEVKEMIKQKALKINWRPIKDYRESIRIFNIFEADKSYKLIILKTGKFSLEEIKNADNRLCKVIGKSLINSNKIQLNFHDGTNIITDKKEIRVGDSIYLDKNSKVKSHFKFEKGREVFIILGRHKGQTGTIESIEDKTLIKLKAGDLVALQKDAVLIIK